jgi:hypothetical protein
MISIEMNRLEELYNSFGCTIINDYEETEPCKVLTINDIDNEDLSDEYGKINWDIENLSEDEVENTLSAAEKFLNGYGYSVVAQNNLSDEDRWIDGKNTHTILENKMAEMALVRTFSSALSLLVSIVVLWKVW